MSLRRARSADEYAEWVKQSVFEIADLKECFEFQSEEMTHFPAFLEPLEQGIKDIYQSMHEGNYVYGREDLPFMDLAERHSGDIPFHTLLKQINETHLKGIDISDNG